MPPKRQSSGPAKRARASSPAETALANDGGYVIQAGNGATIHVNSENKNRGNSASHTKDSVGDQALKMVEKSLLSAMSPTMKTVLVFTLVGLAAIGGFIYLTPKADQPPGKAPAAPPVLEDHKSQKQLPPTPTPDLTPKSMSGAKATAQNDQQYQDPRFLAPFTSVFNQRNLTEAHLKFIVHICRHLRYHGDLPKLRVWCQRVAKLTKALKISSAAMEEDLDITRSANGKGFGNKIEVGGADEEQRTLMALAEQLETVIKASQDVENLLSELLTAIENEEINSGLEFPHRKAFEELFLWFCDQKNCSEDFKTRTKNFHKVACDRTDITWIRFEYDSLGRIITAWDDRAPIVSGLRRMGSINDNRSTFAATYRVHNTGAVGSTMKPFLYHHYSAQTVTTSPSNTRADSGTGIRFAYDVNGRLSEIVDRVGDVTRYEYDEAGRLAKVTNAVGGLTDYSYDVQGRPTPCTESNLSTRIGHLLGSADRISQIPGEFNGDGNANNNYRHDAPGNIRHFEVSQAIRYYERDAQGRLTPQLIRPNDKLITVAQDESSAHLANLHASDVDVATSNCVRSIAASGLSNIKPRQLSSLADNLSKAKVIHSDPTVQERKALLVGCWSYKAEPLFIARSDSCAASEFGNSLAALIKRRLITQPSLNETRPETIDDEVWSCSSLVHRCDSLESVEVKPSMKWLVVGSNTTRSGLMLKYARNDAIKVFSLLEFNEIEADLYCDGLSQQWFEILGQTSEIAPQLLFFSGHGVTKENGEREFALSDNFNLSESMIGTYFPNIHMITDSCTNKLGSDALDPTATKYESERLKGGVYTEQSVLPWLQHRLGARPY